LHTKKNYKRSPYRFGLKIFILNLPLFLIHLEFQDNVEAAAARPLAARPPTASRVPLASARVGSWASAGALGPTWGIPIGRVTLYGFNVSCGT